MSRLNEIAGGAPSWDGWQEATRLLDAMDEGPQRAAVEQFERASAHWPSALNPWTGFDLAPGLELRRSPGHWVKEVYSGQHAPKHALIRILESPRRPMGAQKLECLLLADAPLAGLTQVGFDQVRVSGGFLKALKGDGAWRRWKALRLWTCGLTASALKLLGAAELTSLEMLNLEQNQLGEEGVKGFVKAPGLASLKAVHLGSNQLDASAAQALGSSDWAPRLAWLNLSSNRLYDVALERLAASGLPLLRELDLSRNQVGQRTAAWAKGMPGLETLWLNDTNATDEGVAELLGAAPSLRSLKLDATGVGDRGARAIASSGQRWSSLSLRSTAITPAGLGEILDSPAAAEVERLELGSGFDLANAQRLIEGACPKLRYLGWHGAELGEGVVERLRANPRLKAAMPY